MSSSSERQQRAAGEAHRVGDDREQRQRDEQSDQPRHHEHFEIVDAHRLQRIDLIVEPHDADLGGERAAGAAGDDDRRQQHAHLAQHCDRDQIDGEDLGAELLQLLRAQIRDDHADQEGDQRHDRDRLDAGLIDVPRDRGQPQVVHAAQGPQARDGDAPQETECRRAAGAPAAPTRARSTPRRCSNGRARTQARLHRRVRRHVLDERAGARAARRRNSTCAPACLRLSSRVRSSQAPERSMPRRRRTRRRCARALARQLARNAASIAAMFSSAPCAAQTQRQRRRRFSFDSSSTGGCD